MSEPVKPVIATMVGVASATSSSSASPDGSRPAGNRRALGRAIETAMAAEVHKISEESTAIWNDPDLTLDQKNSLIADLNSDETRRARMLAARDLVKAGHRQAVENQAAADRVKRLEEELAAAKEHLAAQNGGAKQ